MISSPEMSDLDLDFSDEEGLVPIQPLSPLNSEGDLSIPSWNVEKPLEDPTDDFQHDQSWHENDQHPSEFPSTVEASINHQHESAFEKRQEFLSTTGIISRLQNEGNVLSSIPPGLKDNTASTIDNSDNVKRKSDGEKIIFDDCGAGSSGTSPRTYFVIESDSSVKSVVVKNGVYVREKKVNKTRI